MDYSNDSLVPGTDVNRRLDDIDNAWNHIFGRRIMVNMHPEEALVRIMMPYRWRKGNSILWGGCTRASDGSSSSEVSIAIELSGPVGPSTP